MPCILVEPRCCKLQLCECCICNGCIALYALHIRCFLFSCWFEVIYCIMTMDLGLLFLLQILLMLSLFQDRLGMGCWRMWIGVGVYSGCGLEATLSVSVDPFPPTPPPFNKFKYLSKKREMNRSIRKRICFLKCWSFDVKTLYKQSLKFSRSFPGIYQASLRFWNLNMRKAKPICLKLRFDFSLFCSWNILTLKTPTDQIFASVPPCRRLGKHMRICRLKIGICCNK